MDFLRIRFRLQEVFQLFYKNKHNDSFSNLSQVLHYKSFHGFLKNFYQRFLQKILQESIAEYSQGILLKFNLFFRKSSRGLFSHSFGRSFANSFINLYSDSFKTIYQRFLRKLFQGLIQKFCLIFLKIFFRDSITGRLLIRQNQFP